jgi:hypothetical protein
MPWFFTIKTDRGPGEKIGALRCINYLKIPLIYIKMIDLAGFGLSGG